VKRILMHIKYSFAILGFLLLVEARILAVQTVSAVSDGDEQAGAEATNMSDLFRIWKNLEAGGEVDLTIEGDVNAYDDRGTTPLFFAAKYGYSGVLRALLYKGADPNMACRNGWTPLLIATRNGHLTIVRMLLACSGIQAEKALPCGVTPLYIAADLGDVPIVKALLTFAGGNKWDASGSTRLINAVRRNEVEKIKDFLVWDDVNMAGANGVTPLLAAAQVGGLGAVQTLLAAPDLELERTLPTGETALFVAAEHGHAAVIRALLDNHADPAKARHDAWTPIHIAAYNGRLSAVKALLAADPQIANVPSIIGTSLMVATQQGHFQIVKALLDAQAHIDSVRSSDGATALTTAVNLGRTEIVRLLLARSADPNLAMNNVSPLIIAVQKSSPAIVEELLKAGADVNEMLADGSTALTVATQLGRTEIVALLVAQGATQKNGRIPLIMAVQKGAAPLVEELLKGDADVNEILSNGLTALIIAIELGHTAIVKQLLAGGALTNQYQDPKRSPLAVAIRTGNVEIVEALLEANAQAHETVYLVYAVYKGFVEIVRALLAHGASPTEGMNEAGMNLLAIAAGKGYEEIVLALLEKGVNANEPIQSGWTPLSMAAAENHLAVVSVLLDVPGIEVNRRLPGGFTPLQIAIRNNNPPMVSLLLAKKAQVNIGVLALALENGNAEITTMLVAAVADANVRFASGLTPLLAASFKRNIAAARALSAADGIEADATFCQGPSRILIEAKRGTLAIAADTSLGGVNEMSPLLTAAYKGYLDIVCALLSKKVRINRVASNGDTPLLIAIEEGHVKVVQKPLDADDCCNSAVNRHTYLLKLENGIVEVEAIPGTVSLVECAAQIHKVLERGLKMVAKVDPHRALYLRRLSVYKQIIRRLTKTNAATNRSAQKNRATSNDLVY
jgi:ankyrin repeat protein